MKTAVGGMPVLTVDEARDEFMGLGPVDGGDKLMSPTSMQPADAPQTDPAKPGNPPAEEGNDDNQDEEAGKIFRRGQFKTATGERIAFRPARTKLQKRAKERKEMGDRLGEKIKKLVEDAIKNPTHKFSTKEQDDVAWKAFDERTTKAEEEIKAEVRRLNEKQKAEVFANLPKAIEKAINPNDLFDLKNWISITTDATTPIFEKLFAAEAAMAAGELGMPELNPFNDTAKAALHASIARMSESYQTTTLQTLEAKINDGLSQGQPLADISKTVSDIYEWSDTYRADRVAKTEAFRTSNMALKTTWKESGVVKTIKWYTANDPCPFCEALNGKVISIDSNFFNNGDSLTVGEGDDAKTMSLDYGDVGAPPLHPNCMCVARPEDVSI